MIITLIGFGLVALFAFAGYRRGLLRIATFLVSLLMAGMLAEPLAGIVLPLANASPWIPLTLKHLAATVGAGLVVLVVLLLLTSSLLRQRENRREVENLPRVRQWERIGGMIVGATWGFFVVVLAMVGLHLLGGVEETLTRPSSRISASPAPVASEDKTRPAGNYLALSEQIDHSAFAPLVQKAAPLESAVTTTFNDLAAVAGNPTLLERFQRHPTIARFTNNPKIRELAQDAEIARLVQEQQYYALLNNTKIAAVLQDKALVAELRQVEIRKILREVIESRKP